MKYFWYYRRTSYRDAKYNAGFYASHMGRAKLSLNRDYCAGYSLGEYQLKLRAGVLTLAEAKIGTLQRCVETVKRTVAENLQ